VDFASTLHFAQTAGLIYFFAIFAGVLVYALRPKARQKFDRAARMPLDEE
jgi:cytochrome c oxidase cbb3-type subunit 4